MNNPLIIISTILSTLLLIATSLYVIFGGLMSGVFGGGGIAAYQTRLRDYLPLLSLLVAYIVYVQAIREKISRYWIWIAAFLPVVFLWITA